MKRIVEKTRQPQTAPVPAQLPNADEYCKALASEGRPAQARRAPAQDLLNVSMADFARMLEEA